MKAALAQAAIIVATAAAALGLTLAAWKSARDDEQAKARIAFEARATGIARAIEGRMLDYEQALRGGAGLFAASQAVTPDEWSAYFEATGVERAYPGIRGLGYAPYVSAERKAELERWARSAGLPGYAVFPPGTRDAYVPVLYLRPLDEANRRAIGYDMYSDAVRRRAFDLARDSGEPAITGVVTLVQDTQSTLLPGFLMYMPVYRQGAPRSTPEERRRALVGFVYSAFRAWDLVTGVIGGTPGVEVHVTDVTDASSPAVLFAPPEREARRGAPQFVWREDFRLGGRTWRLEGASLRSFEHEVESTRPQLVLAGGLAISTLLVIIVWTLLTVQARARELAHNMTFALRASEERLQLALSSARLALFDWNLESGIVHLGREWSAMLGAPPEESNVPVLKLQMLVHPDDREAVDESVKAMLSGERDSYRVEHRVRRRDASWLWIESVARVSERNAAGRARRVTGVNRDITERKAIDEMKREFVATVSHELRSPLTGIVAALGLVREGSTGELPGKAREFVDLAYANSERLTTLVNDILDIERLEAGGIQLQPEPVLIDRLLERALALNAGYAERYGVRFVVATPNCGLKVEADPERLMQVVTNLLSNAAKHSPGTEVLIEARASEGRARVAVIDHGRGIDPAFRSRLFRKFEQADRTRGGTGLGLAISKGLIERMGGRIGCDSEPGRGSTFWIELPAA